MGSLQAKAEKAHRHMTLCALAGGFYDGFYDWTPNFTAAKGLFWRLLSGLIWAGNLPFLATSSFDFHPQSWHPIRCSRTWPFPWQVGLVDLLKSVTMGKVLTCALLEDAHNRRETIDLLHLDLCNRQLVDIHVLAPTIKVAFPIQT